MDAYFSFNFDTGKPQNDGNAFRAFDRNNGFALNWAGVDIGYSAEQVGATINLRFGPSASVLAGNPSDPTLATTSDTNNGLQFVKQAFATWRPGGGHFAFDFGKFDTIYGVEVADSQKNINYTRGLLYTLAQPHHHTGLRAGFTWEGFTATLMIVNGWNEAIDKNLGKGFGLGVGYSLKRADNSGNLLTAKLGYLVSPESLDYAVRACGPGDVWVAAEGACRPAQNPLQGSPQFVEDRGGTNSNVRHFLDLAVLFEPIDPLLVTFNADYGHDTHTEQFDPGINDTGTVDETTTADWFGLALAGRYRFGDLWGIGLRGEYLADPDHYLCNAQRAPFGIAGLCQAAGIVPTNLANQLIESGASTDIIGQGFSLLSGTLTLEALPVDHLIIRLDTRIDHANADVFVGTNEQQADQFTTTLGVVATTD